MPYGQRLRGRADGPSSRPPHRSSLTLREGGERVTTRPPGLRALVAVHNEPRRARQASARPLQSITRPLTRPSGLRASVAVDSARPDAPAQTS